MVATVRIAITGYRQGLTEARLRQIAVVVMDMERGTGGRVSDMRLLLESGELGQEDFVDARSNHEQVDQLVDGQYRVGDFIFPPAGWSADPQRREILGWTDQVDGFRIMALRDGRTRSLKPSDWDKLLDAGILPEQ